MRWRWAFLCLTLVATRLPAQTVRGTVREAGSGALRGVFIALLDTTGATRLGTLTDENGRFLLRPGSAGRYTIRAELIGHRTVVTASFLLARDSVVTADVALPVSAIELSGITAQAERRCVARPESAAETQQLWEEVRKALRVTAWAEKQASIRLLTRNYVRLLEPRTLVLRSEQPSAVSSRAYTALSPDTLARWGFARVTQGDTTSFFGPDAELLLSDAFLDTHCFHAQHGRGETAGLVGLSFKPVPRRKVPEIVGTLWLDPRTSQLRHIEFKYVNLPHADDERYAGGRTYYRRAPGGVWLIDHWYIRMPLHYPARMEMRLLHDRGAVAEIREEGGEIIRLETDEGETVAAAGVVSGAVYDSVRGAPLRHALVYLSGTSYKAQTDSTGRFTIQRLRSGSYQIAFAHPFLDSLPSYPQAVNIDVDSNTQFVALAVPSTATIVAATCSKNERSGVLTGYVYDRASSAQSGVDVVARYVFRDKVFAVRGRTDITGRYQLCGLALHRNLRVSGTGVGSQTIRLDERSFRRLDLLLHASF